LYAFHDSLVTEIAQFDSSEFSTASELKGTVSMVDKTKVFVVHGRNEKLRQAMFDFLRSIGLEPIEWGQAKHFTGKPSPYIGEILDVAFRKAQAIVVMLTPDDEARLREELHGTDEPDYELNLTPQARPNVLFEAGMAMGHSEDRTVLVEVGNLRPFSDIAGRHTVRLDNSPEKRKELVDCLKAVKCAVDVEGKTDWLTTGDFTVPLSETVVGKDAISITALDCNPHLAAPGQTLTISYTITSQATSSHEVLLGASAIPPSGSAHSDPSQDKPVILRPGHQTVQRYLTIPPQAKLGNYRLIGAVWDMPQVSNICLARMERDDILSIVPAH
jgi:predicted nucleotide-binding protein